MVYPASIMMLLMVYSRFRTTNCYGLSDEHNPEKYDTKGFPYNELLWFISWYCRHNNGFDIVSVQRIVMVYHLFFRYRFAPDCVSVQRIVMVYHIQ